MANYNTVFSAIGDEFSQEIALAAIQIHTLNLTPVVNSQDEFYDNPSEFLRNQARKVLWEMSFEDFCTAWKVYRCIHEWESRQSLQGLGGCVTKTFKQLVAEYDLSFTEKEKKQRLKEIKDAV